MDRATISNLIRETIRYLAGVLPPELHTWHNTIISPAENITSGQGVNIQASTRPPDILMLIDRNPQLLDLWITELSNDKLYRQVSAARLKGPGVSYWIAPYNVAHILINDYFSQVTSLTYEEDAAHLVSDGFINSLNKGVSGIKYYGILKGFACTFDSIELTNGVTIKRLSTNDLAELRDENYAIYQEYSHLLWLPNRCVLQYELIAPILEQPADENIVVDKFKQILRALRLIKGGTVRDLVVFPTKAPGVLAFSQTSAQYPDIPSFSPMVVQPYSLDEADIPSLNLMIQTIATELPHWIQIVIDRINIAALRAQTYDSLIDLIIALEAVYGDGKEAIAYKIKMRCALYIESDLERRQEVIRIIRAAYNGRSAIVHGNKGASELETLQPTVQQLLTIVQITLMRIVQDVNSGKTPLRGEDFDELILKLLPQPDN